MRRCNCLSWTRARSNSPLKRGLLFNGLLIGLTPRHQRQLALIAATLTKSPVELGPNSMPLNATRLKVPNFLGIIPAPSRFVAKPRCVAKLGSTRLAKKGRFAEAAACFSLPDLIEATLSHFQRLGGFKPINVFWSLGGWSFPMRLGVVPQSGFGVSRSLVE